VAERAQRKLQQEKEEFEREKERERKRLMELEEQNKLLRERREANAESSDAAVRGPCRAAANTTIHRIDPNLTRNYIFCNNGSVMSTKNTDLI
jgi:hypothetical protein